MVGDVEPVVDDLAVRQVRLPHARVDVLERHLAPLDARDHALGVRAQRADDDAALDRVHAQDAVRVVVRTAGEPLELLVRRSR